MFWSRLRSKPNAVSARSSRVPARRSVNPGARASARPLRRGGRRSESVPAPDDSPREANQAVGEAGLDLATALIRVFGELGFDIEDRSQVQLHGACERWARHLAVGGPHPDAAGSSADGLDRGTSTRRDWGGAKRFVERSRETERQYVTQSLADLRRMIWMFVREAYDGVSVDGDVSEQTSLRLRRLAKVVEAGSVQELRREAMSAVVTLGTLNEQRQRRQSAKMAELGRQLHTLGRALDDARKEQEIDPLTRLSHRGSFDAFVLQTLQLSVVSSQPATLIMADLDHFKGINDRLGHLAGDEVLRRASDCLARTFPRKGDFVARYGGEEFVVVLRETDLKTAMAMAERFRQAVETIAVNDQPVTVSCGVAELRVMDTVATWVSRADQALYRAKAAGRNRIVQEDAVSPR